MYADGASSTVAGISVNTSFPSAWFTPSSHPLPEVYRKIAAGLWPCFQIITENPSFGPTSPWGKSDIVQILESYLVHSTGAQRKRLGWSLEKCFLPCSPVLSHQHAWQPSTYSSSLPFSDIKTISPTSEMKIDGFYLMVSPSLQCLVVVPLLFQFLYIFLTLPRPPQPPPQVLRNLRHSKTTAQHHPCLLRKGSKAPNSGRAVKCLNLAGMNLGLDHQSRE